LSFFVVVIQIPLSSFLGLILLNLPNTCGRATNNG
jgi:hypothetical protein